MSSLSEHVIVSIIFLLVIDNLLLFLDLLVKLKNHGKGQEERNLTFLVEMIVGGARVTLLLGV